MVLTPSTMVDLGTIAPDFSLSGVDGRLVARRDFEAKPLLVMFICNHCPFVKHLRADLATRCKTFQERGVGVVAISSNDVTTHPDDSPEKMALEVKSAGYTFPYLYDETQEVAKAYRAACTPDFFLFDASHRLFYRGQWDETRPDKGRPDGRDIEAAVGALLSGGERPANQKGSIGCNIKWRTGNAPDYFTGL